MRWLDAVKWRTGLLLSEPIAGVLGFGVVAFAAAEVARVFFFVFVVLFLVSLVSHLFRRANHS